METYDKMAISNENFIHSLTLELGFPATEDDIFEKADAIYTNHILPTIDSTLNKFDHTTEDILIDDMEIDLGEIKECDLSNRLDEKLKYILERRIKQGNQVENHNAKSLLQTDKANQVGSTESVLFTYLKDGTIPWYADESNFDLKNQISNHLEKINDDVHFTKNLFELLKSDSAAFLRLFYRLDNNDLVMLLTRFYELNHPNHLHKLLAFLKDIKQDGNAESNRNVLFSLAVQILDWTKTSFEDMTDKSHPKEFSSATNSEIEQFIKTGSMDIPTKALFEKSQRNIQHLNHNETKTHENSNFGIVHFGKEIRKGLSTIAPVVEHEMLDSLSRRQHEHVDKEYFIRNAGLVLLHPFLPEFFRRLELVQETDTFSCVETQINAIHALDFLSGFCENQFEYNSTLNKILCGLPPSFPIDPNHKLTRKVEREATELARTVCDYWKPLNGTSLKGFQQAFIQRDGILNYSDDAWIVHVEAKTVDILLDDLPWQLSTIVLPWQKDIIYIDWQRE